MVVTEAQPAPLQAELDGAYACEDSDIDAAAKQVASAAAAANATRLDGGEQGCAALLLDKHARQLRSDMLDHIAKLEQALAEQQQQRLREAASKSEAVLASQRADLVAARAEVARQQEIMRRTGNALFRAACWRRQRTLASLVWRGWRVEASR